MLSIFKKLPGKGIFHISLAFLGLFLTHFIWGANLVVAKVTLGEFPVMTLAFLRYALSAILLLPFLLAERHRLRVESQDILRLSLVGLFIVTFNIYFFYEGVLRTSSINASVLGLIAPIISVVACWWFFKEKIYMINLLGTVIALFGGITIIGLPLIFTSGFNLEHLTGNLLIILAGIVFVVGELIARPLLKKYHSITITIFTVLIGVISFAVPATLDYLHNPHWIDKVTVLGLLGVMYITVLSTICASFIFQWAIEKIGLSKAMLFNYLQPAVAASFAVPFLGERISFSFIIGTCLVILGVYWGTLGKEEHDHPALKHHHR